MPIAEGAFVRVLFPTDEKPRQPGLLHIGYCLGTDGRLALIAYTTSQPWPNGLPARRGIRIFAAEEARTLNQKPFVLDLARLARLPLTRRWFPDLGTPSRGGVARANPALRDELLASTRDLLENHRQLAQLRGV